MVRHSSRIELSQSALKRNINFIRSNVGRHPIITSVVKADAYGHGIQQFVPMAEKAGIHHFAAASSFEASEVLKVCSSKAHIMIMGILYDEDIEWVIDHGVEFYVFDLPRLEKAREVAEKTGRKAVIHLEIETGGNRTGLPEKDFKKAINFLQGNQEYLVFKGLCTHLAGAETLANKFRIQKQLVRFNQYLEKLKRKRFMPEIRHIASSAAALTIPEARLDMVRIGIAQYGFWPSPDVYNLHLMEVNKLKDNPLKRMISWKTDIMHLKEVLKDEFIGYGTSFQAQRNMRIAVLPLGYSNGYSRALSNMGYVLIHGKRAPICGLVNMNLFMVDVSHIKGVKVGDEVVLIGRQGNYTITVSSFSNFANRLDNELISRLPHAIPRYSVK